MSSSVHDIPYPARPEGVIQYKSSHDDEFASQFTCEHVAAGTAVVSAGMALMAAVTSERNLTRNGNPNPNPNPEFPTPHHPTGGSSGGSGTRDLGSRRDDGGGGGGDDGMVMVMVMVRRWRWKWRWLIVHRGS